MDRSGNNHDGGDAAEAENVPRHPEMVKEPETKEDGRYIFFYTFEDEDVRGSPGS